MPGSDTFNKVNDNSTDRLLSFSGAHHTIINDWLKTQGYNIDNEHSLYIQNE